MERICLCTAGIHPAVISYLNTRPSNFYKMESTVDGKNFATPRGWEDLSRLIQVYEKLDKTVDKDVVVQYIQHPQIARDFAGYLELFYKYRTDYQIDEVLNGHIDDILVKKAAHASFDEKLSVTGLLLSRLNKVFGKVQAEEEKLATVFDLLKEAKEPLMGSPEGPAPCLPGGCEELPVRQIPGMPEEGRTCVKGGVPIKTSRSWILWRSYLIEPEKGERSEAGEKLPFLFLQRLV